MAILGELDRAGLIDTAVQPGRRPDPGRRRSTPATSCGRMHAARRPAPLPQRPGRRPQPGPRLAGQPATPRLDRDRTSRLHPRPRPLLQPGRRPGRALRQHRREGLHRQDRRRRPVDLHLHRHGQGLLLPGGGLRGHPRRRESRPATWWSSATRGRRADRACRRCSIPTSYLKSMHLGKACALITDGRFSGGTSGLSIGHVSPEAAAGGAIALVGTATSSRSISPPARSTLRVSPEILAETEKRGREEGPAGLHPDRPRPDHFHRPEGLRPVCGLGGSRGGTHTPQRSRP